MNGSKWLKAKVLLSLAMSLLFLTACESESSEEVVVVDTGQSVEVISRFEMDNVMSIFSDNIYILTDNKTAQQYIIWQGYKSGGITPLLEKGE